MLRLSQEYVADVAYATILARLMASLFVYRIMCADFNSVCFADVRGPLMELVL